MSTLPRISTTWRSGRRQRQLRPAPEAAGGHDRPLGQRGPPQPVPRDEGVPRVFPEPDGTERDAVGEAGREILERVHGDVDPAVEHRVVELLGEERAVSDAGERDLLDEVAGGA